MKKIVNSFLALMVVAAIALACSPKTDNTAETEAVEADSTEMVVPADSVEEPLDTASVQ